jgi:hypothetical protein
MINRQGGNAFLFLWAIYCCSEVLLFRPVPKLPGGIRTRGRRKPPKARQGRTFKHSREAGQTEFA